MSARALGPVPPGCRMRLVDHYGQAVDQWLAIVPTMLNDAARRWDLSVRGYHDAGTASVLAIATDSTQRLVLLKAWHSRSRYMHEVAALSTWAAGPVPRLLHIADDLSIVAMELVAGRPGGGSSPDDEYEVVATALRSLHETARNPAGFPTLNDYLGGTVLPRIDRRTRTVGTDLPDRYLLATGHLDSGSRSSVLLHADLYQENIAFDRQSGPIFLDPLPMLGDPAFDWAFWIIYYDLGRDPVSRLAVASRVGGIPVRNLAPWCVTLCIDGLCYYRETGDVREPRMADVLNSLAAFDHEDASC